MRMLFAHDRDRGTPSWWGHVRIYRLGDGIEIQGTQLASRPGLIVANRVTITASEPLGSEKPANKRREREKGKRPT